MKFSGKNTLLGNIKYKKKRSDKNNRKPAKAPITPNPIILVSSYFLLEIK